MRKTPNPRSRAGVSGDLGQLAGLGEDRAASSLLPSKNSEVPVPDQLVAPFIPKTEGERFEAREQGDGLHTLKQRIRFVTPLQVIVGDPRTQMMDVMIPNVAREPLQNLGQFVK